MSNEVHPVFDRLLKQFAHKASVEAERERHLAQLYELEKFAREENDYAEAEIKAQEEREEAAQEHAS